MDNQEAPFCVQVELTEGCNLRCSFCGLNGIRDETRNHKFLTVDIAQRIAFEIKRLGWNPRIEFAMHGEPTLNPDRVKIVAVFRDHLPKHHLMMTSNGGGLLKDPTKSIDDLMEHLNVLALDDYDNVNIVDRLVDRYEGEHRIYYYPKNKEVNPHQRRKPKERDIVVVADISSSDAGVHATLNNHAGSGAPRNDKAQGKRCAKPFREISIRWDGNIAICCNDWRGDYKCGDIMLNNLDDIWQNEYFQAARKKLYHGERDFGPCDGCDALSYRSGLLPDKKGQKDVGKINTFDLASIEEALYNGPFTEPILRPWEV